MGPAGEDAAGSLAEAGLRVVGIEEALVSGECPYWGCVPSKMMIRAADLLAEARRNTRRRRRGFSHARLESRGTADPRPGD